jgi:hypothetical protein
MSGMRDAGYGMRDARDAGSDSRATRRMVGFHVRARAHIFLNNFPLRIAHRASRIPYLDP